MELEHADERRRVEDAVAAQEGVVGDDAAEGCASGGGAGEVSRSGEAGKDFLEQFILDIGDGRRRRRHQRGRACCFPVAWSTSREENEDWEQGGRAVRVFFLDGWKLLI